MKKFNLEYQYKMYLQRMQLDESKMHPVQKIETKRVFFGAFGQVLMLLQNDISELPEEKGVEILESMINQVANFFLNEAHKQN